ncbi:MAG: hypothetical protein WBM50_14090 [Acidimicrobiales bacterium]
MTARLLARAIDADVAELVDALVAAIDTDRTWEIERVRTTLEPFVAAGLFADELRLNGTPSARTCECCGGEGWL